MREPKRINEGMTQSVVGQLLGALGFDWVKDEGLKETPIRVARAYQELLAGYEADPAAILSKTFPADGYDEVVVLRAVPFTSLCEHHLLPFTGSASVAYLPGDRVVGLSKLARLVEAHARRLQIQEAMTKDIATDIQRHLEPQGVAVVIRAVHMCVTSRGIGKPGAEMVTSAMHGVFREKPEARAELLELMR